MATRSSARHTGEQRPGPASTASGRTLLACGAALCFAVGARPVDAQAVAGTEPGIFEIERSPSLVAIAIGPSDPAEPVDWTTYLARYQHVTKTLAGTALGAVGGALMVFVVCGISEDKEETEFLGQAACVNRDRWFGFVAAGSFLGTVLGGARGASTTGGRLGPISPLRTSNCTFRDGMRRSLIGAAIGSLPAVAMFASGSDALESSLVAPVFQGTGGLIATWSCIGEPRLGPIGQPPIR